MSRGFRILLAVAAVAYGTSLSTTTTRAEHDDACWKDQRETWQNHHSSLRRQSHYDRRSGSFWRPGGMWDRLHGVYERDPYYGYDALQLPWYGDYGPGYGYGHPYYGGRISGYGPRARFFGRPGAGFFLQSR